MKIQPVHLALAHIQHEFQDELELNDPYIEKIKDEVRKKESILARQLLNSLCEINVGSSLHQLDFRKTNQGQPVINKGVLFHKSYTRLGACWDFQLTVRIGY